MKYYEYNIKSIPTSNNFYISSVRHMLHTNCFDFEINGAELINETAHTTYCSLIENWYLIAFPDEIIYMYKYQTKSREKYRKNHQKLENIEKKYKGETLWNRGAIFKIFNIQKFKYKKK